MQNIKTTFLCSILIGSLMISNIAHPIETPTNPHTPSNNPNSEQQVETIAYWENILIKLTIGAFLQTMFASALSAIFKWFNKEHTERQILKELILINEKLKEQLQYATKHSYGRMTIKELEKGYLHSCLKIMEFQKKYLEKYTKK